MKIVATIKNAKCYLEMENEKPGSFSDFIWSFTDSKVKQNKPKTMGDISAQSPESVAMSKALKKRGFGFCGPTICYAFMQAVGIINDHIVSCHRYEKLK